MPGASRSASGGADPPGRAPVLARKPMFGHLGLIGATIAIAGLAATGLAVAAGTAVHRYWTAYPLPAALL
ncbi:hypothetical protein AB0G32_32305 [Streptomyces sp. NPDC023723]|uniref:hypothetical protein n=1 Tax=Streptomyces sp. NPDC023723 TaxID=3154323 RepID=UPI0033EC0C9C